MKEKPILFSGPMVRAILEGRKTQTRRVITLLPNWISYGLTHADLVTSGFWNAEGCQWQYGDEKLRQNYQAGDRLWVRETWAIRDCGRRVSLSAEAWPTWPLERLQYIATDKAPQDDYWWNSRPSIHMPRWASRITLEITNIRVERLQEITFSDIRAEGIKCPEHDFESGFCSNECPALRKVWAAGWDAINGKRPGCAWSDNPFVWVIGFKPAPPQQPETTEGEK